MSPDFSKLYAGLSLLAVNGHPMKLPALIEGTEDPRWQTVNGRCSFYTTKLMVPDVDPLGSYDTAVFAADPDLQVEATVTISVVWMQEDDSVLVQSSMTWETGDGQRHESHARYRFTEDEFTRFIAFTSVNEVELEEGAEDEFEDLLSSSQMEAALDVMDEAARFRTYWLQRYPGDELSGYRRIELQDHDDLHSAYHRRVITFLAESGTPVVAMLRLYGEGFAHPADLAKVLEWIMAQLGAV